MNQNCCFCSSLVCQRHMKMQFQLKTVPKISHNCPALLSQNLQAAATCFCTCNHEPHEFCCTFLSRLWSKWPLPRRPCKRRLPKNVWLQCAVAEWFKLGWHGKECKTSLKCCDFHQHQHQQITDVMDVHSQEKMSMFHQDSYVILQRRFFITWQIWHVLLSHGTKVELNGCSSCLCPSSAFRQMNPLLLFFLLCNVLLPHHFYFKWWETPPNLLTTKQALFVKMPIEQCWSNFG